jgi:hypothetical protein
MEGDPQAALAVFRADTLEYVDHAILRGQQKDAAWCAMYPGEPLDVVGVVYSSANDAPPVNRFAFNWNELRNNKLILTDLPPISLFAGDGSSVRITDMQGGVISPSGQLLYLVAGTHTSYLPSHGIHVFDLSTGRRIQRSARDVDYFRYDWDPGNDPGDCSLNEPEGITIWDLDDGRAPHIRGQLHVLMLDNDTFICDGNGDDEIELRHYTHTIYVDGNYRGEEKGTPDQPFKTVGKAYNIGEAYGLNGVQIWDGAQIKIRAGSYDEKVTFSKRIRVLADRGTVTIGQ